MLPSTADRVSRNTSFEINDRIRRATAASVAYHRAHPDEIEDRLAELDEEWDIERALEANAAVVAFAGIALGALSGRRWLLLPAAVTAFLLQHATQGWCPPLPVLRRLGFRTAKEIEAERHALIELRDAARPARAAARTA